ncbi:sigma-70 family RNA polymerase sigma factor [Clostridium magnum]
MNENVLINEIILAKSGDKAAMEAVIKSFTPCIIKNARSIYINGHEVSDLIQIGRLSIIKAVNMFDINKSKSAASYIKNSIVKNFYYLMRGTIKKVSCCSLNSINDEGQELIDTIASEESLEEKVLEEEEKAALKKAVDKLPEKYRDVILWFYIENKTLSQYSKEKGIPYRTVKQRKDKALEKLKDMLKER